MSVDQILSATYSGIVEVRVDRAGNLRLLERVPFLFHHMLRQRAFHPAGEWETVSLSATDALVALVPTGSRTRER
jgi:hypothetical protein